MKQGWSYFLQFLQIAIEFVTSIFSNKKGS